MPKPEDQLSLELYITLAVMTGIIGVVLLALAVLSDAALAMRVLRVATSLMLLVACQHTAREALRIWSLRKVTPSGSDRG